MPAAIRWTAARGVDSLFGESGNDWLRTSDSGEILDGGADNDLYEVSAPSGGTVTLTDASGVDRFRWTALTADPAKTVFSQSGNDLIIQAYAGTTLLASATILNMATAANQVETLELIGVSGTVYNYNLVTAWNWALTHPGFTTGGTAYTGSTFTYTGYAGDGPDSILGTAGNDVLYGWGGNDTINAGAGSDRVDAGGNDDVVGEVAVFNASQTDVVDGGSGTDTLNLDMSAGNAQSLRYVVYNAAGAGTALDNSASLGAIQAALSAQDATAKTVFYTGTVATASYFTDVTATGFEIVNLTGTVNNNDLLIYKNGASYDGKTGTDTFYADWSAGTAPVVWTNTGAAFTYNGTTVSNVERLLLQTGSGNDAIDNSAFATNDEIVTGTGNDTINAGAGSDRVDAGGNDDVVGEVAVFNASQTDVVDGGSGTDTLNLDMSAGNAQSLRYVVYNAAGAGTALDYTPPWERFRPLWPLKMRRPRQI